MQEEQHHQHGEHAQRHVDPEHPPPARPLGEPSTQQRSGNGGESKNAAHHSHVLSAFPGRYNIGDDGLGEDHQPATAEALQRTAPNEPLHVGGQPAHNRTGHEDANRNEKEALAAHQVAELAVNRHHDRGCEDIGGNHPEHLVHTIELTHDGWQRRAENHLVERCQEH